jgi:hypothetical protein
VGFHAVGFAPVQAPAPIWPAVAEAIYRVRRAERLSGQAVPHGVAPDRNPFKTAAGSKS